MPRYDLRHWSVRARDQQRLAQVAVDTSRPTPHEHSAPRSAKPRPKRPKPTPDPIADALLGLCAAGRLYEVEEWLAAGKPITVPDDYKRTPLRIARQAGFRSLVELLLRHTTDRSEIDELLVNACADGQRDLVELALKFGADATAVPFCDALLTYDRPLVSALLSHGADPVTGLPFARAFHHQVQPLLGIYLDAKRDHPEHGDALQAQLDMALRQACDTGTAKSVALLRWAGGNPRTAGRTIEEAEDEVFEAEPGRSALEIATCRSVDRLKTLKFDPAKDDVNQLMRAASWFNAKPDVLAFLLKHGADPNDKPNGGSTALESCLTYVRRDSNAAPYYSHRIANAGMLTTWLETLRMLVGNGALWRPDESSLAHTRRALYQVEPDVLAAIADMLQAQHAAEEDVLERLLRTSKMQQMLRDHRRKHTDAQRRAGGQPRLTQKQPVSARPEPSHRQWYAGFKRDQLYEEVWAEPARNVARRYGVSDVMVAKACRVLGVPKPPRGYWAKKSAGLNLPARPSLPAQGG